jgi:surface protein
MAAVFTDKNKLITAINNYLNDRDPTLPDISTWDVSAITDMSGLFKSKITTFERNTKLEGIGNWNVGNVTHMSEMFSNCSSFNQPLNDWDVSKVTNMSEMFYSCDNFNQSLFKWTVSNVTNMSKMFYQCVNFNRSLNDWVVSNVTDMSQMFYFCNNFNQPLNDWDVSNVTDMSQMFYYCDNFNQPLNDWNVSNVKNMSEMFYNCKYFNQPLNDWDVSKVTNMRMMFYECKHFNQPLNDWDVSNVKNMSNMFFLCLRFNQDISMWTVNNVTSWTNIFYMSAIIHEYVPVKFRNAVAQHNTTQFRKAVTPHNTAQPTPSMDSRVLTYKTVSKTPVDTEPESTDLSGVDVFNIIEYEHTPIYEYYEKNIRENEIIFIIKNTALVVDRFKLGRSIVRNSDNVKYVCSKSGKFGKTSIIKNTPYLSLRSINWFDGIVKLSDIKYILENTSGIQILYVTTPSQNVNTTSLTKLLAYTRNEPCEQMPRDTVYTIKLVTPYSLVPHQASSLMPPPTEPPPTVPPSSQLTSNRTRIRASRCTSLGCSISGGNKIRRKINTVHKRKSKRGTRKKSRKTRKTT